MKLNQFIVFLCFVISINTSFSQNNDSLLNDFATNYSQEKIFIHFDKSLYNTGETIWFKAYLMADDLPSTISKNFYIDWYNDSNNLIKHDAFPIFASSTNGQFEIPKTYKGKFLHAKAYTTWMLNFDTAFLFHKTISLYDSNAVNKPVIIKPRIDFFVEGGNFIQDVSTLVAFKCTNQFGIPLKVKGVVKDEKDEFIDSIITEHDGMGLVYFENPKINSVYTAYWQDEVTQQPQTTVLPSVSANGLALQVEKNNNLYRVKVTRTNNATDDQKYISIQCFINARLVYLAKLRLVKNNEHSVYINADSFPTGIMQVTAFNANNIPLAERIVFINNNNYAYKSSINVLKKSTTSRGKNVVEFEVADSVSTNMSVAIIDDKLTPDSNSNIITNFLLTSDIKGYVHQPNYYFKNPTEITEKHLDLVMLTNGWRKYNWKDFYKNELPIVYHKKDTSYLSLIGKLNVEDIKKLIPNQEVYLMIETIDSIRKNFPLVVDSKGVFEINNMMFYDKLKVFYTFLNNKKLNPANDVIFNNGLFNKPNKNISITSLNSTIYIASLSNGNTAWLEEYKRIAKLKGIQILDEVKVKTRVKRKAEILDDKYTSGMFKSSDAFQFDLTDDVVAAGSGDVFNYLEGRVPGLRISNVTNPPTATWRGATTAFFLDEMNVDVETLRSMNLNTIAYIKAFRPPFFGAALGGAGGAIALYTKKGEDLRTAPNSNIANKTIDGYSVIKQFYNPNYETETAAFDTRTTLYWNPYVVTTKEKNKVVAEFFNNDVTKKFRAIFCGFNQEGKMCWVEKVIE